MKPKYTKLFIVIFFCIIGLFSSISAEAQTRQAEQSQSPTIDKNKQALQEIEAMREMIHERREQQERQRRMLQELQQATGIETQSTTNQQTIHEKLELEPSYQPPIQKHISSGSTLSQMEAEERQDKTTLQQKYNIEMQISQKEIEMLKKQLTIANKQL